MSAMGVAGGALGAIGGLINTFAGGGITKSIQKSAQQRAKEDTKHILKNQILWRMQDLEQAGLNPILAAGAGLGGAHGGSTAVPGFPSVPVDVVGSAAKGMKMSPERKLLEEQAGTARSAKELNYKLKDRAEQDRLKLVGETAREWSTAELNNLKGDLVQVQAELEGLHLPSARAVAEFYRSDPGRFMKKFEEGLKAGKGVAEIIRDLGIGIGGAVGGIRGFMRPRPSGTRQRPWQQQNRNVGEKR